MPSVTYMNQSAPFWDWVASLEQGASNPAQTHPWFTNQNNSNEEAQNPEAEGESAREHDGPAHLPPPPPPPFAPWGWGHGFGGGRGFPFRGPPPHHRHGRRHEREDEEHEHHNEKDGNNEKEGEKNDNGEGPSGSGSGSETEGGHRRCGGRRGGKGRCGGGGRGRHGWGPYHEGPGPHGPRGFGHGPGPHHGGPHHGGPHGHGRRGGPWGGRGGFNPWAFAANWLNPENFMAGAAKEGEETTDFSPEADIFDTNSTFVVHISLPGAKKEDVGVNWDAEKSELSIAGVVYRPGDEDFLKTLAMDERKVGPFERKIRLGTRANPAQIDAEGITAKLEDGILRVEVPKRLDDGFVEVRKVDIE